MELDHLLAQTAALHAHLCPRQVLGVRMGLYAATLLDLPLPQTNKRLIAFVETDGCFADGFSVATGCWLGRRTLRLIDYGKVAATVIDTQTDQAWRIWPQAAARERACTLLPDAPSRWHAQLQGYQLLPVAELLHATPVKLHLDLNALIGQPGIRATCARCAEEILNGRELWRDGVCLCPACAHPAYYH